MEGAPLRVPYLECIEMPTSRETLSLLVDVRNIASVLPKGVNNVREDGNVFSIKNCVSLQEKSQCVCCCWIKKVVSTMRVTQKSEAFHVGIATDLDCMIIEITCLMRL